MLTKEQAALNIQKLASCWLPSEHEGDGGAGGEIHLTPFQSLNIHTKS